MDSLWGLLFLSNYCWIKSHRLCYRQTSGAISANLTLKDRLNKHVFRMLICDNSMLHFTFLFFPHPLIPPSLCSDLIGCSGRQISSYCGGSGPEISSPGSNSSSIPGVVTMEVDRGEGMKVLADFCSTVSRPSNSTGHWHPLVNGRGCRRDLMDHIQDLGCRSLLEHKKHCYANHPSSGFYDDRAGE